MRLYGTESREVLCGTPLELAPGSGIFEGEIEWAVRSEAAATLEDALYRRLRAPLYAPAACGEILEPAAARMAELLGWDDARTSDEIDAVRKRRAGDLAFAEAEDD